MHREIQGIEIGKYREGRFFTCDFLIRKKDLVKIMMSGC
jgi:hypothetical protein